MPSFPEITCAFLADLEQNNHKEWFEDNRKRYEREWLEPAKEYVAGLSSIMAGLTPSHQGEPKINKSIRRINRDVRFSNDKTPYDPRLHMVFWTGSHPTRSPAIHIVLHPAHAGMGAGHWAMTPDQLQNYRHAVCQDTSGAQLHGCGERLRRVWDGTDRRGLETRPVRAKRAARTRTPA